MPDEILDKIKYLCKNIPKVEWSGMLFYSIEGSIKDPKNLVITLEDILPMDKGTAAYTEYDIDSRYEDFLLEEGKEHRMDWYVGHIHSHNTMAVYFSATDKEELNDNSASHNFYLSLIVNNFMDFCAKVAFRGTVETTTEEIPYYALDEEGEKYVIDKKEFVLKKEKLFIYDCDILSKAETVLVESDFAGKVAEIMKPKPAPVVKSTISVGKQPQKHVIQNQNNRKVGGTNKVKGFLDKVVKPKAHPNIAEDHTGEEIFALTLLNFSNPLGSDDDIDSLMSDIEEFGIDGNTLCQSIMNNYASIFENHFPFYDEQGILFVDVTEKVVEFFDEHEQIYPILSETIDNLKQMLTKFEEYGTIARVQ